MSSTGNEIEMTKLDKKIKLKLVQLSPRCLCEGSKSESAPFDLFTILSCKPRKVWKEINSTSKIWNCVKLIIVDSANVMAARRLV